MKKTKSIIVIHAADADQHLGHLKKILDILKQEERIEGYTTVESNTVDENSFNEIRSTDMVVVLLTNKIVAKKAPIETLLLEVKNQVLGVKLAEVLIDNVPYETSFIAFPTSLEPIRASEDMDSVWQGIAENLKKLFPKPVIEKIPDPIPPVTPRVEKTWLKKNKQKLFFVIGFLVLVGFTISYWGSRIPDQKRDKINKTPVTSDQQRPQPDFKEGSTKVYSALFSEWPVKETEHGIAMPQNGKYLLKPLKNTWVGPGGYQDINTLKADFVLDFKFRINERNPSAALSFSLKSTGKDAAYIEAILTIWNSDKVVYSLTKGRIKDYFHLIPEERIAERELVPEEIRGHNWKQGGTLTLMRQGGMMQFFLNGTFVNEFRMSKFSVKQISVGAAFNSSISISSIEARVP